MDTRRSLRSPRGEQREDLCGDRHSRTVMFPVRLTPAEREALGEHARERGLSLATYIRAAALGTPLPQRRPEPRPVPAINGDAYWQLGQVGNNLNQVARRLNIADGEEPTLAEVQQVILELQALLKDVRLRLIGWDEEAREPGAMP